jgi:hypothetical protein
MNAPTLPSHLVRKLGERAQAEHRARKRLEHRIEQATLVCKAANDQLAWLVRASTVIGDVSDYRQHAADAGALVIERQLLASEVLL